MAVEPTFCPRHLPGPLCHKTPPPLGVASVHNEDLQGQLWEGT